MWRSSLVVKSLFRDVTKRTIAPTIRAGRTFSSSGYRDPGYMVSTEGDIESDLVKVPLFTDLTRLEMYKKFKEDPELWTIKALSNHYNCSLERTKAVIFLLRLREQMMIDKGVNDIKEEWNLLTDKYTEDPVLNTYAALAEQFEMKEDEVKEIIAKMLEHRERLSHVAEIEEEKLLILEGLEEDGVDTQFRETTIRMRNSIRESYTESLFGDDGYEATKYALIKRVEAETKSEPQRDVDYYMYREEASIKRNEELAAAYNETAVKPSFLRCKIAFKDMSKGMKEPTLIRMRNGRMRAANPLEEAFRSWTKHPSALDMGFHKEKLVRFKDFDGDDERAGAFPAFKRAKMIRIKEELAAKALAAKAIKA